MQAMQGSVAAMDDGSGTVVVASWYLSGGVNPANCIGAYAAKGAASLAASYVNLANPGTYDLTLGSAPTLGANGWTFAGAQYLKTGITAAAGWTAIVKFSGAAVANGRLFAGEGDRRFGIVPNDATGVVYLYGSTLTKTPGLASGVLAIANSRGYRNGVDDGAIASTGTNFSAIYIGCRNIGGSPSVYYSGNLAAISFYSSELTLAQIQAVGAAMP
jgi:hypothetical protein